MTPDSHDTARALLNVIGYSVATEGEHRWAIQQVAAALAEAEGPWRSIIAEIGALLKDRGCSHGSQAHESTPPMMYPEWIGCVLKKAVAEARTGGMGESGEGGRSYRN